jgi:hypothetical protein
MGNRFKGGIASGAMPALHRYFGNSVLSFLGRLFFHTPSAISIAACADFAARPFARSSFRRPEWNSRAR